MAQSTSASSFSPPSPSSESADVAALKQHFATYGWVRIPATLETCQFAWRMEADSRRRRRAQTISGDVQQFEPHSFREAEVRHEWEALVKRYAQLVGVDTSSLHVVDSKLLVAKPKTGKQAVHFDSERKRSAHDLISCILISSYGCYGTALPIFPTNELLSFSQDQAEMQSVSRLLGEEWYSSQPALPGDIILFRHSTPHFGVQNVKHEGNRVVLFAMLSPFAHPGQDKFQEFPWLYHRRAWGPESEQFAFALLHDKATQPVQRLADDESLEAAQEALACLDRYELLAHYQA